MISRLVCVALTVFLLLLIARSVLSWFGGAARQGEGAAGILYKLTEPVLAPVRRALPPVRAGGVGLDLAPLLTSFGILIVRALIC